VFDGLSRALLEGRCRPLAIAAQLVISELEVFGPRLGLKPGDAFYVPPGHLQRAPAKEMAEVEQQIMKNMQAMQAEQT
jgi:hypothetical protein